jgi:hypothetical protein
MHTDAIIGVPAKNVGDLSKNTVELDDLMFAILRAVDHVGIHKATSRKQGVSFLFHLFLLLLLLLLFLTVSLIFICSATMGASYGSVVSARSHM